MIRSPKKIASIAVASTLTLGLAACGSASSDPFSSGGDGKSIVVGSANFSENIILGEVYAQSLERAGYKVDRRLDIGSRDILYGQMGDCKIQVAPEYNGALLNYLDPKATTQDKDKVFKELETKVKETLKVLPISPAQDTNALVMQRSKMEQMKINEVSDLQSAAPQLTIGAPPEFEARNDGLAGLKANHGINFKAFKPLDYSGPITLSALRNSDIDVGLLFSTTPDLAKGDLVALKDPQGILGVNNVVPLICEKAVDAKAQEILNGISQKMTTDDLVKMNSAYTFDKKNADAIAASWIDGKL
ncbi:ABC transporter substrate-binding protein [Arthrobacter sp. StoSoilB5]|uniref:glycine betaine ABC transporter substrate-binding protein n=1 Tax=Arthrobacter sp. StoSoilB5 TaxID=2830992 RepID=UPI001CC7A74D|nr:ABC transporter substrate-binding protein [Arthrobacter sp. StoSoilB5]BCW44927.1 glycine/betaine ABC transporter substrate-binding protein [Arthrobacter sp. StoSoilB5]